MFKLENGNVVKVVASVHEKEKLLSKGFVEIATEEAGGGRSGKIKKAKADTGD